VGLRKTWKYSDTTVSDHGKLWLGPPIFVSLCRPSHTMWGGCAGSLMCCGRSEHYKSAFDMLDSSGDGEIELTELENALSRITADGGTVHGTTCSCRACQDWALFVQVTSVDWPKLQERFRAVDTNNSGSICLREFVGMAEGRPLQEAEARDVERFETVRAAAQPSPLGPWPAHPGRQQQQQQCMQCMQCCCCCLGARCHSPCVHAAIRCVCTC
jgi:hypothetical protein